MMVLLAAICCIRPKPQTSISSIDNQRVRDIPKKIRPTPKAAVESRIILPRPRTVFLTAREIAEINAPTPTAAIRKPRVCGPPCRIVPAKTGISTVKGQPSKLTAAKSNRMVRMGAKPETYVQPSRIFMSTESGGGFMAGGGGGMGE